MVLFVKHFKHVKVSEFKNSVQKIIICRVKDSIKIRKN